jgi:hypothetical protein
LGRPWALGARGGEGEGGPPGRKKRKEKKKKKGRERAKSGGGAYPGAAAGRAFLLQGRSRVGDFAPG